MSRISTTITLGALLAACAGPAPRHAGLAEGRADLDPQAAAILRRMCDTLRAASRLRFEAQVSFDEVLASGTRIEHDGRALLEASRTHGIYGEFDFDVENHRFWYDGEHITVLDVDANEFATAEVSGHADAVLDRAAELGIAIPFADLLYSDPYAVLTERVVTGSYLGVRTVDGVKCHHLALVEPHLEWQIWVEDGERPVPRKLTIVYRREPGSPRFTGRLAAWDLAAEVAPARCRFAAPAGSERIEFLALEEHR